MAQLRCAQTSELLAEGTPLEIATAADGFPKGDVLFDGVGEKFNPAEVRKVRGDEIAGLEAVLAEMPSRTPAGEDADTFKARKDGLTSTIAERRDRIAAGEKMVAPAKKARDEAIARVEERKARGR